MAPEEHGKNQGTAATGCIEKIVIIIVFQKDGGHPTSRVMMRFLVSLGAKTDFQACGT